MQTVTATYVLLCSGVQGDKGAPGLKGEVGDTGSKGLPGRTGIEGDVGESGMKVRQRERLTNGGETRTDRPTDRLTGCLAGWIFDSLVSVFFVCPLSVYMNNHIYSTLFKTQERESSRRSKEIEQRKESQKIHTLVCLLAISG